MLSFFDKKWFFVKGSFFFLLFVSFVTGRAQTPDVSIDTQASGDVMVCDDTGITFTITLRNIVSNLIHDVNVYPNMPSGITFTPGSALLYTGDSDQGVAVSPASTSPLYFAVGDLDYPGEGVTKKIVFNAKADCNLLSYLAASGKLELPINNQTKITYSMNGTGRQLEEPNGSESYNVLFPVLDVFVPATEKKIAVPFINRVVNRHITIRNSGDGRLSKIEFYLKKDSELRLDHLYLHTATGDIELQSISSSPELGLKFLIDDFSGAQNGNAFLEEGESIVLTDYVAATTSKGSIETIYTALWGCNNTICNPSNQAASFATYVEAIGGAAAVDRTENVERLTDFCAMPPGVVNFAFTNYGSNNQPASRDGAFNVKFTYWENIFHSSQSNSFFIKHKNGQNVSIDIAPIKTFTEQPIASGLPGLNNDYRKWVFDFNDKLTEDLDGPEFGLEDLDGDGFFDDLPQSFTVKFVCLIDEHFEGDVNFYTTRGTASNGYFSFQHWSGQGQSTGVTSSNSILSYQIYDERFQGSTDLVTNTVHTMSFFLEQYAGVRYLASNNGMYRFEITVPPGVKLTAVRNNFNNVIRTLSITEEGGKYIIIDPLQRAIQTVGLSLDFELDCNANNVANNGTITINPFYYYGNCTTSRFAFAPASKEVFLHCGNCTNINTTAFKVQRETFGWVRPANDLYYKYGDLFGANAKAQKVNASTPGIKLSSVYPGDDLSVNMTGTVDGGTYTNLHAEIYYRSPVPLEAFKPSTSSIIINGQTFQLGTLIPQQTKVGDVYTYIYDIPLGGNLPSSLNQGSTLEFKAMFVVSDLTNIDNKVYNVMDFRGSFFSTDAGGGRISCGYMGDDNFEIINSRFFGYGDLSESYYFYNDGRIILGYFGNNAATPFNYDFTNEFRPITCIKSLTVTLPKGFIFDTTKPLEGAFVQNMFAGFTGATYSTDRKTLTLTLDETMPVVDYRYIYYYAYVKVDCSAENRFEPINEYWLDTRKYFGSYALKNRVYLGQNKQTDFGPYGYDYSMINKRRSDLLLTANTEQEGYTDHVQWPIQLANKAEGQYFLPATKTWVAVELQANDQSTVIEDVKDASGKSVPFESYGPTDALHKDGRYLMFQVGDIPVDGSVQFYIVGRYNNCQEDKEQLINVFSSWDMYSYPQLSDAFGVKKTSSIADIKTCENVLLKETMAIKYKTAALQWTVDKLSPDRVDLCVSVPFEIDLTSTKYADMTKLKLTMDLPSFVSLDPGVPPSYNYPYAGPALPMPFKQVGNLVEVDVTSLTGGTLPGIRLPANKIKIKFNLITSCGFDPGSPVRYTISGFTNCGDVVTYVDQRKIKMTGFDLDDLELNLLASVSPIKCSAEDDITLTIKNNGTQASSANTVNFWLPAGTNYQQVVAGDLGIPTIAEDEGRTKLTWALPEAYLSPGQTKNLVIRVFLESTPSASTEIAFEAKTTERGNVLCAADNLPCVTDATSGTTKLTLPVTGLNSLGITYNKFVCAFQFAPSVTDATESTSCALSSYLWTFDDGTTSTEKEPYHSFEPGTHNVSLTVSFNCNGCGGTRTKEMQLIVDPSQISFEEQTFTIETETKNNILQVSASTFSNAWPLSFQDNSFNDENSFVNGTEGVWRNDATYVYQTDRKPSSKISEGGTFSMEAFNWNMAHLDANTTWTNANAMTEYSPFSYELENRDVLGVYSAALYDYGGDLPTANGINMRNREMAFTSFEYPDQNAKDRFLQVSNGITGNWVFGSKPVPMYKLFSVYSAQKNVAVVEAKVADLEQADVADVIAVGKISIFGMMMRLVRDDRMVCVRQHPENPDWSIVVFERAPFDGLWVGSIRIRKVDAADRQTTFANTVKHSGNASLQVSEDRTFTQPLLSLAQGKSYSINAWVSIGRANLTKPELPEGVGIVLKLKDKAGAEVYSKLFKPTGKIIEGWQQIKDSFVCPASDLKVEITFNSGAGGLAYYDDLRLHPTKGNMKSYVYDTKSYRLKAILDEENYASFFYYDQEGNLYLTKKETEEGIKTLTESVNYQYEVQPTN